MMGSGVVCGGGHGGSRVGVRGPGVVGQGTTPYLTDPHHPFTP